MSGAQIPHQPDEERLQAKVASADTVLLGEVTEVHPLQVESASSEPQTRVSHHIPKEWCEAVIKVNRVLKGSAGATVVVRFTPSQDVAWFRAPKLQVGQQAVFLLSRENAASPPASSTSMQAAPAYASLQPGTVLSTSEAERIRSIVSAPSR
jgi:hypothetical protein